MKKWNTGMTKKTLLLLLSLTLAFSVAGMAAAEEGDSLHVGDQVAGFVVQSVTPMDPLGATGVLFEHVKTGAQLLYLDTEDTNRSFDITFRTPALDDKGKPHVFEHITICGSQKYPDPNLFFPFANQTYSTYVNAATYHGMTTYPVASLSEDQLMTMMDYYLSGVFSPLLYTEPRMVQREAWRYELTDADQPLAVAGTVYSEMQGALSIASLAYNNNSSALFKDSPVAHVSGGRPEAIRTLTHQELIDFHDTYYHPSNALIILYGKLDYVRFMSYIDEEYLSGYDKADIHVEMGAVEPYGETLYATYDAPVEQGAPAEDASYIYYSFAGNGAGLEDVIRMDVLTSVLSQESSPLMRTLRQELPNASVSVYMNIDLPVPSISFTASGVNESDRDVFVKAVDDCIAELSENGLVQGDLDAVLAAAKLSLLLTAEDTNLGVNAGASIALCWTYFNRIDYYSLYEDMVDQLDAAALTDTLNQWLANNAHRAVSVTRPVAGLAEKNAAELAEELASVKAAMTPEEVDALVRQSAEFVEWSAATPSSDIMEPILNVTADTLPEEIVHYDVADETVDGIRYITAEAKVNGVANVSLMLDGSTIPVEQLQDAELYLNLLGQLDTAQYTKEELSPLLMRYLNGFGGALDAQNSYAENGTPLFATSMSCWMLQEDVPQSVALLRELLMNTNLTDTDTIRDILNRDVINFPQYLEQSVLGVQVSRLRASFDVAAAYMEYLTDFDFYRYKQEMLALDDATLTARLEAARDLVNNRHNAILRCAGNAECMQAVRTEMTALLNELPDTERKPVDYSVLLLDIEREAVVVNSTVQMNIIYRPAEGYSGKDGVLASLVDDVYMLPKLRNALGAYGAYAAMGRTDQALYTYRDPNLAGTYEIFEALPEYLRTAEITQNMVDTYIVGSYSNLARPQGLLSGAMEATNYHLLGYTEEARLQRMREAKATSVEDVRALAERIQNLVDNGVRSTSATASTIEANSELFDTVVRLEDEEAQEEQEPAA